MCVITFVARWLHSATWCQVRSILSISTWNGNTCQDDPSPDPDNMDHPDHIAFWPIIILQNLWTNLHQIVSVCSSSRGTPYMLRIVWSINKSKFYGHCKRIRISYKRSSTSCYESICLELTELIEPYIETIYIKYHRVLRSRFSFMTLWSYKLVLLITFIMTQISYNLHNL